MKATFTAGQRLQINGEADFFRLLATTSPVTIDFYFQGREIAERLEVEAGFAEQFRTIQFDRVDIVSPLAQTVQFETALGSEIRYDRGAASITGTVEIGATSLAALARPDAATGFFSDSSTIVANTPLNVFTPAANTNGAILLTAYCADSGINTAQVFIAKTSAPTSFTDGEVLMASTSFMSTGTAYGYGFLPSPQFIHAGKGLYFISSQAGAAGQTRSARYRLL
jgi:hypothetical protein